MGTVRAGACKSRVGSLGQKCFPGAIEQSWHGGNPVLRWMASNVAVEEDAAGNLKPSRRKSSERIDGVVALINALGRGITAPEVGRSVYATRGVLVL